MTDVSDIATYLRVQVCGYCKGKGGFYDTTYDRTGTWSHCRECGGTGQWFDANRVRKLLGWKLIEHD